MSRHNIKLNYSELEKLATSCMGLGVSLDEIKNAVKNTENTIANCKGQAVNCISGDGDKIVDVIEQLKKGLDNFATEINSFVSDMRGIINSQEDGIMQVNSWDCNFNLVQMIMNLVDFNSYTQSSSDFVLHTRDDFSLVILPQEEIEKVNQINANIESIAELVKTETRELLKYEDVFQKIKKIICDFESKDDDYRNSMQNIYYDVADIKWYKRTSTKIIIAVAVIAAAAALIIFAPVIAGLVGTGGVIGTVASIASSATVISIATDIVSVGIGTGVLYGGVAIYTGDDVEDALGAGLMDGVIAGTITGGAGVVAESTKLAKMGTKLSEFATSRGVMLKGKTSRFLLKESVEYASEVAANVAYYSYNGNDLNMLNIFLNSAFDRGLHNCYNVGKEHIYKSVFNREVDIINESEFSFDDFKKALESFITDRSLEVAEETTKQGGHKIIDNMVLEDDDTTETSIYREKIPQNLGKDGIKNIIKDALEEYGR